MRYQKILKQDGGPIDHFDEGRLQSRGWGSLFRFDAFLLDHLRPASVVRRSDGAGANTVRSVAQFTAVSEALESWAFGDRSHSSMRDFYGFDIDTSTHGMAAFPGLFSFRARQQARREGLERYAVLHWWEGKLRHIVHPGAEGEDDLVEIETPDASEAVVIAHYTDPVTGLRSYGFGAGDSLREASTRARLARLRNRARLDELSEEFLDLSLSLLQLRETSDRRLVYFATQDGQNLFDERLRCGPWSRARSPLTVFDGLIPGDWDRYAAVWRCLYEPPSDEHASSRSDYFFW